MSTVENQPPRLRLLTEQDLAEMLGVSTRTIRRMHATGELPRGKRVSPRVVRWSEDVIKRWFEKRPSA